VSDVADLAKLNPGTGGASCAPGPLRQLIERAQTGDRQAFNDLVVWHQRRVISTAWRILGNEADALDAAQEVFLRLHRYLRSFRTDEDFAGWLYRLIVNACHDLSRKRSGHLSYEAEAARGTFASLASRDDVEGQAIVLEDERLLAAALDTLSEKERAALVLRDLEGLSTQEVADILGSSATTVRSQICLGRAKLRAFRDRHQGTAATGRDRS
jgi:RNA polymerase sigma-70 factor (ECF subfamily)